VRTSGDAEGGGNVGRHRGRRGRRAARAEPETSGGGGVSGG